MARAQDAQTVTGGQIDPYVQQSLMQGKQQASNRLIAAMQEQGATARQSMSGKQQMEQQKLAGEQAAQRSAAEITAEDRRAAEMERGRREDRAEQQRQFNETQKMTTRLADRQFAFEKAVDDRDYEQAERLHKEMMAERRVGNRIAAEQGRQALKLMVAQFTYGVNRELGKEKAISTTVGMKNKAGEVKSAHEQSMTRIRENLLADKRFAVYRTAGEKYAEVEEGPVTFLANRIIPLVTRERHSKLEATRNSIQQQAASNGSNILIDNLRSERYAALERDVASGKITETSIRSMYTTLEASKEAIRAKLEGASEKEEKEWNSQLLLLDGYETTLDRLKTSAEKVTGSDTKTVGNVARTGLDVIQGVGVPGVMDVISEGAASDEEFANKMLTELQQALEPGAKMMYQEGDDEETMREIDEINIGRGFNISKPSISIEGGR